MLMANVNLSATMVAWSGGISPELFIDLMRASQGFPTMCFAILSKQNKSASAVPSLAIKLSLYL
jgi:hypothetical protein